MNENIIFQDDGYPKVIVTSSRITVDNINYDLSNVGDVRYDIETKIQAGAGYEAVHQWPNVAVFAACVLASFLFPPLAFVGFGYCWLVIHRARERNKYDVVKISFTRSHKKIVCYEADLGTSWVHPVPKPETKEEYQTRCDTFKKRLDRAKQIADAIGKALESHAGP